MTKTKLLLWKSLWYQSVWTLNFHVTFSLRISCTSVMLLKHWTSKSLKQHNFEWIRLHLDIFIIIKLLLVCFINFYGIDNFHWILPFPNYHMSIKQRAKMLLVTWLYLPVSLANNIQFNFMCLYTHTQREIYKNVVGCFVFVCLFIYF